MGLGRVGRPRARTDSRHLKFSTKRPHININNGQLPTVTRPQVNVYQLAVFIVPARSYYFVVKLQVILRKLKHARWDRDQLSSWRSSDGKMEGLRSQA